MSLEPEIVPLEEKQMTKQRLILISLVGILSLSLLLGVAYLYQIRWVDVNTLQQGQKIVGVTSAKFITNDDQKELRVVTNHLTNLRLACQFLEKMAGKLPIRYLDQRDEVLVDQFDVMQFALQQGLAQGDFTEMENKAQKMADGWGVQLELEMDSDAIYVIMNHGEAQLIEVIERNDPKKYLPSEKQ